MSLSNQFFGRDSKNSVKNRLIFIATLMSILVLAGMFKFVFVVLLFILLIPGLLLVISYLAAGWTKACINDRNQSRR